MSLPDLPIYCTSHAARRAKQRCGLNSDTVVEKLRLDEAEFFLDGTIRIPVDGPKGRGFAVILVEAEMLNIVTVAPFEMRTRQKSRRQWRVQP